MSVAISVNQLTKEYRIARLQRETMLQEQLANFVKRALRRGESTTESMWALKNVSFQVTEGEVVGIIGRNGAGKSTLLKILSKITYPTSGTVSVRGRVASLLEVGTGFHEELTGRENIFLNGSILGMSKADVKARMDEIIEFSGVERFIDTPIKRYSSGMRLRLGFAVAAHLEPDLLIIDEVLAVGDAGFQKKCLDAMGELRSGGRTVLFVSHNMAAVENLCQRGIWIDQGTVRMDGPVKEVIAAYMASFAGATNADSDLLSVEGRSGTGEVRYTRVEMIGAGGQRVIHCGDAVCLRLHYRAVQPVRKPVFWLGVATDLGTTVMATSTWAHGIDIPVLPVGTGHIDLEIDALPLLPARYPLSMGICGAGTDPPVYDNVEHGVSIEVADSDIYGGGRQVSPRWGIVGLPQRWKLNGEYIDKESMFTERDKKSA